MGAGANAGGFAAGFGKGLSNALLKNRERSDQKSREEAARKDRLFGTLLPVLLENVEDPADLEPFLQQQFPDQFGAPGKVAKKGAAAGPFDDLKRILRPMIGLRKPRPTPEQQTAGPGGGYAGPLPSAGPTILQPAAHDMPESDAMKAIFGRQSATIPEDRSVSRELPLHQVGVSTPLPVGPVQEQSTGIPPGFPVAASPVAGPAANAPSTMPGVPPTAGPAATPAARRTLMGVPIMSADDRLNRTIAQQGKIDAATVDRARALLPKLREQMPNATMADALRVVGVNLPAASTATPDDFTLSPGQTRFDASGKQKASVPASASASDINTIDEAILVADRAGDQAEVKRLLGVKQQMSAAGREPKAGTSEDTALAEMAANNPAVLQGLTPTVTGGVLSQIAKNPTLRARYEQVRMEPVRSQTGHVLQTMGQLLNVDPTTGKINGLSDGAKVLYGKSQMLGRQFVPGSASANARAALAQVTGQQALDLIATMKAQSKTGATGFGQLSVRELGVLEASASILKGNISEELALEKLTDLYEKYQKILQPGAGESASGSGGGSGSTPGTPAAAGPIWKDGKLFVNGVPIN